jgi:hypothetical protein
VRDEKRRKRQIRLSGLFMLNIRVRVVIDGAVKEK